MIYRKFAKRIIDLLISISLLLITLPIFIIVALICFISFRGKVFFVQKRIGKNEIAFNILKFITMRPGQSGHTETNETSRLTKIGRLLRILSLDELPQLINIIKGEMSLIGPRPLLVKYLQFYRPHEKTRHSVRPGITGLAQINGRNNLSWEKRLAFDVEYVNKYSFRLDAKIFIITLYQLFLFRNINPDPRSAMLDLDDERKLMPYKLNEKFILRKPILSDATQILKIKSNIEVNATLEKENNRFNEQEIVEWINFHNTEPKNCIMVIEDVNPGLVVGYAGLYDMDFISQTCIFGIMIGIPSYWHKGIGSLTTIKMIEIARYKFNMKIIKLLVLENNVNAIHLYEKIGFKKTQHVPDVVLKGDLAINLLEMQIDIDAG